MIVGMIDFKNPMKQHKCRLLWLRNKESLYDYWLERRGIIILQCKCCGQLLCPRVQLYGPNHAGWQKEKSTSKWICHQCSCGWGGFDEPKEAVVKKRNEEVMRKINFYVMTHPWVRRIRYK